MNKLILSGALGVEPKYKDHPHPIIAEATTSAKNENLKTRGEMPCRSSLTFDTNILTQFFYKIVATLSHICRIFVARFFI